MVAGGCGFVRPLLKKGSDTPENFHQIGYIGMWGKLDVLSLDSGYMGELSAISI